MKKLLNAKIVIPSVAAFLLFGTTAYIFFAPPTWWKPVYIKFEEETAETNPELSDDVKGQEARTQSTYQPNVPTGSVPSGAIGKAPQMLAHMQAGQPVLGVMYELDTEVVNLADPGGLRYLQSSIVLEFWPLIENYYNLSTEERLIAEDTFRGQIDTWKPIIDDIVMTQLSSKTYQDIATIEGKDNLKKELMDIINEEIGYQGVINIYFTDFVIQ
jgi:flagellar FliL protein